MSSEWELDEGIKSIKSAWRREHTARANLEKMLEQAEAENAKLREELADAPKCEACEAMLDCDECLRADDSKKERKRLACENAKLRELVRDFDKCLTEAVRLAYIQGHMTIYDGTLLDSLHPRMRELGIEVSDAG